MADRRRIRKLNEEASQQAALDAYTQAEVERAMQAQHEHRELVDYSLADFTLYDADGDGVVLGAVITAADLEMTIEGASNLTVTIEDEHFYFLRSAFLASWTWGQDETKESAWIVKGQRLGGSLDDIGFTLVQVSKAGTTLTLVFEEDEVNDLRRQHGAKKAFRDRLTRAEFVQILAKEARVKLYAPELHVKKPIQRSTEKISSVARKATGEKGLDYTRTLNTKDGAIATPGQKRLIERALDVATSMRAPERAVIALIEAMIIESVVSNDPTPDNYGSLGLLQATPGTSRGITGTITTSQALDIEYVVASFLVDKPGYGFTSKGGAIYLARAHPDWLPGTIAQAVEGSAYPERYEQQRANADRILAAYSGEFTGQAGAVSNRTAYRRYAFARGRNEDSWDCTGRLADEVSDRRFMRKGILWYASEEYLFQQAPAIAIYMDRDRGDTVQEIDFTIDVFSRIMIAECTITAFVDRWTALPGMVVVLQEAGPADGNWLVANIKRDLMDASGIATITVKKPLPAKPEPAPESFSVSTGGYGSVTGGRSMAKLTSGGVPRQIAACVAEALRIDQKGYPYVWGGGHAIAGKADGGTGRDPGIGYDCSGSTGAALAAGGMGFKYGSSSIPGSSDFVNWGAPGPGRWMTVWYSGSHVFIEFKIPGFAGRSFNTADGPPSGPHLRPGVQSTSGMTPRHWPGM